MKKTAILILLPKAIDKDTLFNQGQLMVVDRDYIANNGELQQCGRSDKFSENNSVFKARELHICTTEEIKEGDWIIIAGEHLRKVEKIVNEKYLTVNDNNAVYRDRCKKIIASTDSSLNIEIPCPDGIEGCEVYHCKLLPTIPQIFIQLYIKLYNEGKKMEKCMVEYDEEEFNNPTGEWDSLRLNGNEIIVSECEEKLYTREQYLKLGWELYINFTADDKVMNKEQFKIWFDKNY